MENYINEVIEILKKKYKNHETNSTEIATTLLLMEKAGRIPFDKIRSIIDEIVQDKMVVEVALIEAVGLMKNDNK